LRVATRVLKPFVLEDAGNLTGFSVELWQEIAALMNVRTQWIIRPTVRDLLDVTRTNEADVAIAAISITEERERSWDFSQPMFDAGLQILVPDQKSGGGIGRLIGAIFNESFLPVLLFMVVGVLIAGHVVWFFERRRDDGLLPNPSYFPGIFEATWWAAGTLATQANDMPRSAAARIVSIVWMFSAVLFIAFFTAAVTSSLTVDQLRGDIQGPDDLPGKRIATVRGSTSAEYLIRQDIPPLDFTTVDEAIEAMLKGEAEAVVYDAPVLLYYASHEGKGKATVVGQIFRKEDYGILFPAGSQYRKPVNEALLRLRENGTYDRLTTKWFGNQESKKT
jgi:polar amino acid transport system substrate-binding protein